MVIKKKLANKKKIKVPKLKSKVKKKSKVIKKVKKRVTKRLSQKPIKKNK